MLRVLSSGLWGEIEAIARTATRRHGAIAYVTDEHIRFGDGDVLVCDASDQRIATGDTSAAVLRRAFERNAKLYSLPGLHAKVVLLDTVAVIGSANMTRNSADRLVECAVITTRLEAMAGASQFIDRLRSEARVIDESFLRRIEAIPVERRGRPAGPRSRVPRIELAAPRTWLIGLGELVRDPADADTAEVQRKRLVRETGADDEDIGTFWFTGHSRFYQSAKAGDLFVEIHRPGTRHRSSHGVWVYPHSVILEVRRVAGTRMKRFQYRASSDVDDTKITWAAFRKLAKRAGLPGDLGMYVARELTQVQSDALMDLWREPRK